MKLKTETENRERGRSASGAAGILNSERGLVSQQGERASDQEAGAPGKRAAPPGWWGGGPRARGVRWVRPGETGPHVPGPGRARGPAVGGAGDALPFHAQRALKLSGGRVLALPTASARARAPPAPAPSTPRGRQDRSGTGKFRGLLWRRRAWDSSLRLTRPRKLAAGVLAGPSGNLGLRQPGTLPPLAHPGICRGTNYPGAVYEATAACRPALGQVINIFLFKNAQASLRSEAPVRR
ncbi:translation initiation factor IF-2-like [Felis catus]|uniref:translation initiation factor IF-2-like n=1 Tax=Felis catus TaxID=9685 RepID=UPI001D1A24F2|nr:translation initiation factor IF-2-like [Felis catus]